MDVQFFSKEIPQTPIFLSNGSRLVFDTADGITGYTLTADPGVIAQLERCIRDGVGGVSRCTAEDYQAFVQKKMILPHGQQPRQWREEVRPNQYAPQPDGVGRAVAAKATATAAPPAPLKAAPVPEPAAEFKPKVARKRSRTAINA